MSEDPKVNWKEFLKGKQKHLKSGAKRNMLFEIRKRAIQHMEELTLILENLKNVSNKSERDYAKIFNEEKKYYRLLEMLDYGFSESYKSKVKLANLKNWKILHRAVMSAGLGVHSEKKMFDANYRNNLFDKLKRKEKSDGIPYIQNVHRQMLYEKMWKKDAEDGKEFDRCPKCGLELEIDKTVNCPKCGPTRVIGDLFSFRKTPRKLDET